MRLTIDGWTFGSDAAVAVGRFRPTGAIGYRAKSYPNAPIRPTREEAMRDEARYRLDRKSETLEYKTKRDNAQ
jgi:hypothetical protein